MYSYRFADEVENELIAATRYFLCVCPSKTVSDFVDLIDQALEPVCRFPMMMPERMFPNDSTIYRKLVVWHFAMIYRINEAAKALIVERIYHTRSRTSLT